MLTGADVKGCKYSGCSKCPVCAVNILITRIGSRFAWRSGSRGVNKETTAPGRDSVLPPVSLRSIRVLTRSAAGRYFIGEKTLRFADVRYFFFFSSVQTRVYSWFLNVIHADKSNVPIKEKRKENSWTPLNVPKDGGASQFVWSIFYLHKRLVLQIKKKSTVRAALRKNTNTASFFFRGRIKRLRVPYRSRLLGGNVPVRVSSPDISSSLTDHNTQTSKCPLGGRISNEVGGAKAHEGGAKAFSERRSHHTFDTVGNIQLHDFK